MEVNLHPNGEFTANATQSFHVASNALNAGVLSGGVAYHPENNSPNNVCPQHQS